MSLTIKNSKVNVEAPAEIHFRTWHLFYLTALIAVGMFAAGVYSLVISGVVLATWWILYGKGISRTICVVVVVVTTLACLLLPPRFVYYERPRWADSANNIRQCVIGMLNYESDRGHCPPAWLEDETGMPMHSWRVLLLPYLEQDRLYAQYNFDEPWNGPNNSKLVDQMPEIYRDPYSSHWTGETIYKLVLDEGSFSTTGEGRPLDDAVDGAASTIVVVEDRANPVNWMKPDGISINDAIAACLNKETCHYGAVETNYIKGSRFHNVATLDGAMHRISPDTDPELLRAAMRSADGVSPDLPELSCDNFVHKPGGYVGLVLYVLLLGLPGWFLRKRSTV